jgi:hypothetical protein
MVRLGRHTAQCVGAELISPVISRTDSEGQLAAAMQRIGELSMEIELLRAKMDRPGPLARRRSR